MTQNIGLDALTDDQLVELARAMSTEMIRRNPAVLDAATTAMRDAVERARASQDVAWAAKKWLATMVTTTIGARWQLNVWRSDRGETRVYLERSGDRRNSQTKACLFVTGNSRQPPGSLTVEVYRTDDRPDERILRVICEEAARAYPSGININCDQAAETAYVIAPMPATLDAVLAAIAAEEDAKAARADFMAGLREEIFAGVDLSAPMTAAQEIERKARWSQFNAAVAAYDAEHGIKNGK